jgi:hypothetical protein
MVMKGHMNRCRLLPSVALLVVIARLAIAQPTAEPVHFSKLMPLLPDPVEGFIAEKAEGSTTATVGFKLTEVSRRYHKGKDAAEATVVVKLVDSTGNPGIAAAHAAMAQFSHETSEGYEKGFTLDGHPAIERYTNESKDGSLIVFVAGRYLVEITIQGLDSPTLQEWWKKIDVKKLTDLKG